MCVSATHFAQFQIYCIMSDSKTTQKESNKVRYSRNIVGFMTSSKDFSSAKDIGIKFDGEPIPYIDNEGNVTTTNVINVSTTSILAAKTECELLQVLSAMCLLNAAVNRTLINMILSRGKVVFTRELMPAGFTPFGSTEALTRDCYITTIESIEGSPVPVVADMVMRRIMANDIYEPEPKKLAMSAPVIGGIAPQQPE